MTDPTGRCFLSYKRERAEEVSLLVAALHDVGVPTWQDAAHLRDVHVEEELTRVLDSPETAAGLLWVTPEVRKSATIRRVEAPALFRRADREDGFFCVTVAAGGLDWRGACEALGPEIGLHGPEERNIRTSPAEPLTSEAAATVAGWVLEGRLAAIHRAWPPGQPLRICLDTRTRAAHSSGTALALDLMPRFEGRQARPGAWEELLLPALRRVGAALRSAAPGRAIEARGHCAIPAAVALGSSFVAPAGVPLGWWQPTAGRPEQLWSLAAPRAPCALTATTRPARTSGTDLALLVSINADVRSTFNRVKGDLSLRAITEVRAPEHQTVDLVSPGEAVDVARKVQAEIYQARSRFGCDFGCVHLFLAVPLGLALLIGQLLNTFPVAQTYELVPAPNGSVYRPAARLRPSGE